MQSKEYKKSTTESNEVNDVFISYAYVKLG